MMRKCSSCLWRHLQRSSWHSNANQNFIQILPEICYSPFFGNKQTLKTKLHHPEKQPTNQPKPEGQKTLEYLTSGLMFPCQRALVCGIIKYLTASLVLRVVGGITVSVWNGMLQRITAMFYIYFSLWCSSSKAR